MAIFNFLKKEREPISKEVNLSSTELHTVSNHLIHKENKILLKEIKKIKGQENLYEDFLSLFEQYDKSCLSLKQEPSLFYDVFTSIEDMMAKLLVEYNAQKRFEAIHYTKTFKNYLLELVKELDSERAFEFLDKDYFETYATYVFVSCEKEELIYQDEESNKVLSFIQEEYEKKPSEALENKQLEIKEAYNDIHYRLSDYFSMEKSISFYLFDLKGKIRRQHK